MTKEEHLKLIQDHLSKIEAVRSELHHAQEEHEKTRQEYQGKVDAFTYMEATVFNKLDDLMGDLEVLINNSRISSSSS